MAVDFNAIAGAPLFQMQPAAVPLAPRYARIPAWLCAYVSDEFLPVHVAFELEKRYFTPERHSTPLKKCRANRLSNRLFASIMRSIAARRKTASPLSESAVN
jgi:hypothetical protein